jgi:4-nitrophenyl phosphatase
LQAVHVRDAGDADCTAAEAAVMGLDRHVTYEDLARFCRLVDRLGAFVLTNPDLALPSDDGVEPGNGAFGRLVEAVTGVTPTVVGKPEPFFVEYALDRFGAHREEAFLVGDNPSTDVALGRRAGMYTIQVRTGLGQALSVTDSGADLVVDSVADLFRARIPG